MRKTLLILFICALGILQVTVLDRFRLFGIKPDLLFACAIAAGINFDLLWVLILCALSGALKDFFGTAEFGLNTALFCAFGFIICRIVRKISIEESFVSLGVAYAAAFFFSLAYGLVLKYYGEFIPLGIFLKTIILQPLYTLLGFYLISKLPLWKE